LCDVLTQWARAYALGESPVSDDVYDRNYILLKEFEAANPSVILDTSPPGTWRTGLRDIG
jgi:NAD-dependent DNA ligase